MRRGSKSIPGSTTTVAGAAEKAVGKLETLEGSWSLRQPRKARLAGVGIKSGLSASSGNFLTCHASSHGRSTKIAGQNSSA
ncbi:unnamed protein product [Prunus brigantina]